MAKKKLSKVICDIDGTIANAGRPIKEICNWIRRKAEDNKEIIYLTNRPEAQRAETLSYLKETNMPYAFNKNLILNDTSLDAPEFKTQVIQQMIDKGETIYAFIDDRIDTRESVRNIDHPIIVLNPKRMRGIKGKEAAMPSLSSYSQKELKDIAANTVINKFSNLIKYWSKNVKIKVPTFIKQNAKRGLELNRQGYGGDGLVDKTIREARDMAKGTVSFDKCVRMSAWFARHKVDTKAEGFKNKKSPKYPSAGLVAWLLWGGDADGSLRAQKWADRQTANE